VNYGFVFIQKMFYPLLLWDIVVIIRWIAHIIRLVRLVPFLFKI